MKGPALIRLALETLGSFDFGHASVLEVMSSKMLGYLDDENESIRRAAALAFCRVQHRNAKLRRLMWLKRERGGHKAASYDFRKVRRALLIFSSQCQGLTDNL